MILSVTRWEQEFVSGAIGGHQQAPVLTAPTMPTRRRWKDQRKLWAEEQAEKKRDATQIENEEDCWAGVGTDDAEQPLPGMSVRMQRWAGADLGLMDWPGQMEKAERLEEEWNEFHLEDEEVRLKGSWHINVDGESRGSCTRSGGGAQGIEDAGVDAESCYKPPREEKSHPPGRRWGLPHGCSEPRPQQTEIQITYEVLSILAEAALENRQIEKAMEALASRRN